MARTKLEMVSASEVLPGETVHFTAAGVGFIVTGIVDGAIEAYRTVAGNKVRVPFDRFTMVVVER
jgi:hypothetical protein